MALKTWLGGNVGNTGDYSVAANWEEAAIPATNDEVLIPAHAVYDINAGLNQAAVAIENFTVEEGFSKNIGTTTAYLQLNISGSGTNYFRYSGNGSMARINFGASAITPEVRNTGAPNLGQHALEIKGTALTGLHLFKGNVGLGVAPGDATTQCDKILVSYLDDSTRAAGAWLEIGEAITDNSTNPLDIDQTGGIIYNHAAADALNITNSIYHQVRSTWTTMNAHGSASIFLHVGGGTNATSRLYGSSSFKLLQPNATTFTNVTCYRGTRWWDEQLSGTYSTPIFCPDGIHTVNTDFGPNRNLAVT